MLNFVKIVQIIQKLKQGAYTVTHTHTHTHTHIHTSVSYAFRKEDKLK
jgi:hypothetical protein